MSEQQPSTGTPSGEEFGDALRSGVRRARLHLVRAGIEVVAGVAAVVDELIKAKSGEAHRDADPGPERIELE